MEEENRMEKLYEQLREDLSQHRSPIYYDEDELIDIFDYAGDVHDDYVRLAALMLGKNLFPESAEIMKRQAVFLASLSNDALRSFMSDNKGMSADPMWEILSTRAANPSGEDAVTALETIISRRLEDDETIIQFVALVRFLQQEEWLIKNLARIRKQCSFAPTLMYEIARLAETNDQISVSLKLLEELTMIDPFNVDYWGLLAELQCNSENYDESLTSLEYAKAIAPDDNELLALEGFVRLRKGETKEAIAALQSSLQIDPNYYPAKRNMLEALKTTSDTETFGSLLNELFLADPSDQHLLMDMLRVFPSATADTLARFYSVNDPDELTMMQHVGELCADDHPDAALAYIRWFRENFKLSQTGDFAFLELLYINGKYGEAYDFICRNVTAVTLKPNELPILGIIASTLLRLAMFDETRDFCSIWIDRLKHPSLLQNAYRLINRGLLATLTDIYRLLSDGHTPTDEEINRIAL